MLPSSNTVSTANELSRFAEILRRGGELDGVRVIEPETLRAAVKQCRRLRPDVATGLVPLRWGTGYMLGSNRFGPVRPQRTRRVRPHRLDATSRCGPTLSAVWPPVSSAAASPGAHREAKRYPALMDLIAAELPRAG